jgi:hypothetical protein
MARQSKENYMIQENISREYLLQHLTYYNKIRKKIKQNPLTAKIAKFLRKGRKDSEDIDLLCVLSFLSIQAFEELDFACFAVKSF